MTLTRTVRQMKKEQSQPMPVIRNNHNGTYSINLVELLRKIGDGTASEEERRIGGDAIRGKLENLKARGLVE